MPQHERPHCLGRLARGLQLWQTGRGTQRKAKLTLFGLDIEGELPRILEALLKKRILKIGVAVCAVAAVLGLAIVPATHLHRSLSGKPLVHSHLINDPVEHADTFDHGDHQGVRTFAPAFIAARAMNAVPALTAVAVFVLARPDTRSLGYSTALDAPVMHGPPLRLLSLRGPPA